MRPNSTYPSSYTAGSSRSTIARGAAELPERTILADQVVVATGPFQQPRIPPFAASVRPDVYQAHSTGYRRPSEVPPGRVVVVGGGNTGYQIAEELAG